MRQILAALLAIGGVYIAYPYATLYRLHLALRSGDAATLQMLVDWPAVREGITEDISDLVINQSAESKASSELPPFFGAGFRIRGIAANSVTARVTPQTFATAADQLLTGETKGRAAISVPWAFFDTPTQSSPVHLRTSSEDPADQTADGIAKWALENYPYVATRRVARESSKGAPKNRWVLRCRACASYQFAPTGPLGRSARMRAMP